MRILIVTCLLVGSILLPVRAEDAPDAISTALEKAKVSYAEALGKAGEGLVASFQKEIAKAAADGNLTKVKAISAEKDAFELHGATPSIITLKLASSTYEQQVRKARQELDAAYTLAVRDLTKAMKFDKAEAAQVELEFLRSGGKNDKSVSGKGDDSKLIILCAVYGQNASWLDVTAKLEDLTKNKSSWSAIVDTKDWGEPAPGWSGTRSLVVRYSLNGKIGLKSSYQGQEIKLP